MTASGFRAGLVAVRNGRDFRCSKSSRRQRSRIVRKTSKERLALGREKIVWHLREVAVLFGLDELLEDPVEDEALPEGVEHVGELASEILKGVGLALLRALGEILKKS